MTQKIDLSNLTRAQSYEILGLEETATEKEIKKAFQKLAAQYHPDRGGDEQKFKEINAAYQRLNDPRPDIQPGFEGFQGLSPEDLDTLFRGGFGFPGFGFGNVVERDPFAPKRLPISDVTISLTFEESVLGCIKEVVIPNFAMHCKSCQGSGNVPDKNACKTCNGSGVVTKTGGNAVMRSTCPTCKGRKAKPQKCDKCNGIGYSRDEQKINLPIRACSLSSGDIKRLNGLPVRVQILIMEDFAKRYREENDVHSTLTISLLEALQGTEKVIPTVHGTRNLIIPAKARHSDRFIIEGMGGATMPPGNHVVTLNVEYPENCDLLVQTLASNTKNPNDLDINSQTKLIN